MSLKSGNASALVTDAIENAFKFGRSKKGCVVVAAAGNTNSNVVVHPAASHEYVLAVGATNSNGKRWSQYPESIGSNYGPELDVVAPGADIYVPGYITVYGYIPQGLALHMPHLWFQA